MSTHTLTLENKPVNDIMDLAWMRFIIVVFFYMFYMFAICVGV